MALEQITFNIGAFNDSDAGGNNYFTDTVFEVKNQSDNTFATIYADSSGTTQIPQNGIDNVSNSRGECNFYIDDGDFYLEVDSQQKRFSISKKANEAAPLIFDSYYSMLNGNLKIGGSHSFQVGEICSTGATYWRVVSVSNPVVSGDFKNITSVYASDFGINFDGSDESGALQAALNEGFLLHLTEEQSISYSSGVTISVDGSGIAGGYFNCLVDLLGIHIHVTANNATVETTFNGGGKNGRGVVRIAAGVKGFKSSKLEFNNFYSATSEYMVPLWIETDGTEFNIDKVKFRNIKNLADGSTGDAQGSIRLVNMQGTTDNSESMRIGVVDFDNVFCVDSSGNRVREDSDAVVTAGFVRIPVTIDLIKGRNIGKRCLKTQAKGLFCKAIHYTHTVQDLEHDTIFDQQDSDNVVGTIRGYGNIFSFYRSLARDGFEVEGGGVNNCFGETSYKEVNPVASARGVLDVQAGIGIKFPNWNVKGGKLGVRLDIRNNSNIKDVLINGSVSSDYSHYIRNLNPNTSGAVIDGVTFCGKFTGTSNDDAPSSDIIVQNGGLVSNITYSAGTTITSLGEFDINARVRNISNLYIESSVKFDSNDAIAMDIISVNDISIDGSRELSQLTERQVLRFTDCSEGSISNIIGSKITGTSEGLVSVNGCANLSFSRINNKSTGKDITFKDNGSVENTGCHVDLSTTGVTAVSTYTENNLEWDGAPSYGSVAGAVSYVRRGFLFTDSSNSYKTYVWSGFNYVATT